MPRSREVKVRKTPQYMQDARDVLDFLEKFPRRYFTRSEIARGSGVKDNHRIGPAVCLARAAAEGKGARVESYGPSKDPRHNGALALRYIPAGKGDADGVDDANRVSRSAITRIEEARRACDFASKNRSIEFAEEYAQVGNAFGACLTTVSGVHELSEKLWRKNNEYLELAARLAKYESVEVTVPSLSIVSDLP